MFALGPEDVVPHAQLILGVSNRTDLPRTDGEMPDPGERAPSIIGSPRAVVRSPEKSRRSPAVPSLCRSRKVRLRPRFAELIRVFEKMCFSPSVKNWLRVR